MTVAHIYTVAFQGIEARPVDVQVHIADSGAGQFNVVGLADKAVAESRERVRAAVAQRVAAARDIQRERLTPHGLRTNAQMEGEVLEKMATPEVAGSKLLTEAAERMQLTARGYHRVLKVARTIADLGGAESVGKNHVAEALSYRRIAHL